ncbi:activating molecule in BECN1-regulated autophagy protein 1A-like [Dysidea avara]|uniref:activating molecule in BECN1-regulated autophagy protein 1A-like n=1 Tax=Dysidea avara TaxID=196820 RepID=UPI00332DF1B0
MYRNGGLVCYLISRQYGIPGTRGQKTKLENLYENWHSQELGKKLNTIVIGAKSIFAIASSADNQYVACATARHDLIVLKIQPKICYYTSLSGHKRSPICLAFHPTDSRLLVSGSLDKTVILWDIHNTNNPILSTWNSYINPISAVNFNPVVPDILLVVTVHNFTCLCVTQSKLEVVKVISLPVMERIIGMAKFHPSNGKLLTATRALTGQYTEVMPRPYPSGFCCELHFWDNVTWPHMKFNDETDTLLFSGAYICTTDSCSMNGDLLACMCQQSYETLCFEIMIVSTSPKSWGNILTKVKCRLQINSLSLSSSGLLLLTYTNFANSTSEIPWHWGIMKLNKDIVNDKESYSLQCVVSPYTPYSTRRLFSNSHHDPTGIPNNAQWLPYPIMGVVWGTSSGMLCIMSNYYSW